MWCLMSCLQFTSYAHNSWYWTVSSHLSVWMSSSKWCLCPPLLCLIESVPSAVWGIHSAVEILYPVLVIERAGLDLNILQEVVPSTMADFRWGYQGSLAALYWEAKETQVCTTPASQQAMHYCGKHMCRHSSASQCVLTAPGHSASETINTCGFWKV